MLLAVRILTEWKWPLLCGPTAARSDAPIY